MMNYYKDKIVEGEIDKEQLPFKDCLPEGKDFQWMKVNSGARVENVVKKAQAYLANETYRAIVWTGCGRGITKTISCVEILKRSFALYQVTRMRYQKIEEHWNPKVEGLEPLVVTRKVPAIDILVSLDVIDSSIKGLQKPCTNTDFWQTEVKHIYQRPGEPFNLMTVKNPAESLYQDEENWARGRMNGRGGGARGRGAGGYGPNRFGNNQQRYQNKPQQSSSEGNQTKFKGTTDAKGFQGRGQQGRALSNQEQSAKGEATSSGRAAANTGGGKKGSNRKKNGVNKA